ncbi:MAG: type II CAAX endopeptidase family protein [Pseudomonadota bacterium]
MRKLFEEYVAGCAVFAPRASVWRMVLVVASAVAGQVVATVAVFPLFAFFVSMATEQPFDAELAKLSALGSPLALVAALTSFLGSILFVWGSVRLLHGINPRALLSFRYRFEWRDMLIGFAAVIGIGIVAVLLSLPVQAYVPNVSWPVWLFWVGPVLAVTLIQVFAEELLFRGYLQSHLAARFANPLIWMGVPSVLFGAAHIGNAAAFGSNAWLVLLAPTLVGLIAADVTARTGGIAAAVGIHLGNNALGLLLVAVPGPFGVVSLFTHPLDLSDAASVRPFILMNIAVILVGYGLWLLYLRLRAR